MNSPAPEDAPDSLPEQAPPHGPGGLPAWRRLARRPAAVGAAAVITVYALAAAGSWVYEWWCARTGVESIAVRADLDERWQPPSRRHWFGTDYRGRDVFWRTVFAARTAFQVGILAGAVSIAVGVVLGAAAGYFGGAVDALIMWLYSTFAAMPSLLFVLAFALLFGRGVTAVYLGIGLTSWVGLCRVMRGECMRLRSAPFIEAARVQGLPSGRIIIRHLLPNTWHLIIVFFTIRFAGAVLTEVIVSFLGLGVQFSPSWGVMIASARERLWQGVWWELTAAAMAMFGLVLAVNILGDALRDTLDPRLREF